MYISIITTTPSVEGYSIKSYLDIVTGHVDIIGTERPEGTIMAAFNAVGNKAIHHNVPGKPIEVITNLAIEEMKKKASALGANAIIGVSFHSRIERGTTVFFSYGTAVIIEPITVSNSITINNSKDTNTLLSVPESKESLKDDRYLKKVLPVTNYVSSIQERICSISILYDPISEICSGIYEIAFLDDHISAIHIKPVLITIWDKKIELMEQTLQQFSHSEHQHCKYSSQIQFKISNDDFQTLSRIECEFISRISSDQVYSYPKLDYNVIEFSQELLQIRALYPYMIMKEHTLKEGWQCGCGHVNMTEDKFCKKCGFAYSKIVTSSLDGSFNGIIMHILNNQNSFSTGIEVYEYADSLLSNDGSSRAKELLKKIEYLANQEKIFAGTYNYKDSILSIVKEYYNEPIN